MLGYKLLAPCDPESVIKTEYGTEWNKPISKWDFAGSPHNIAPQLPYSFQESQYEQFRPLILALPTTVDVCLVVVLIILLLLLLSYCLFGQ